MNVLTGVEKNSLAPFISFGAQSFNRVPEASLDGLAADGEQSQRKRKLEYDQTFAKPHCPGTEFHDSPERPRRVKGRQEESRITAGNYTTSVNTSSTFPAKDRSRSGSASCFCAAIGLIEQRLTF